MEQNEKKKVARSIRVSQAMVFLFAAAVLVLDLFGPRLCRWLVTILPHSDQSALVLMVCLYSCSVPAFWLLYRMHRLLRNLADERIFLPENVNHMRSISRCCFLAGYCCLVGGYWFPSLVIVTLAACFVGLIVRIVRNVFQQAIAMKDELELTV